MSTGKKHNKQKDIGWVLLVVVIVTLLAIVAWFVWRKVRTPEPVGAAFQRLGLPAPGTLPTLAPPSPATLLPV